MRQRLAVRGSESGDDKLRARLDMGMWEKQEETTGSSQRWWCWCCFAVMVLMLTMRDYDELEIGVPARVLQPHTSHAQSHRLH